MEYRYVEKTSPQCVKSSFAW